MTTKPKGGGLKALVAGPLKRIFFGVGASIRILFKSHAKCQKVTEKQATKKQTRRDKILRNGGKKTQILNRKWRLFVMK